MWVVAAVFAILFAYSVRTYISANFLVILVTSLVFYGLFIYVYATHSAAVTSSLSPSIDAQLLALGTSFITLFIPCALFAIVLVSHKKHELKVKDDLPTKIQDSVRRQLIENPIYYKSFDVDANIEYLSDNSEGSVRIDLTVTMVVFNRTGNQFQIPHRYSRSTGHFRLN